MDSAAQSSAAKPNNDTPTSSRKPNQVPSQQPSLDEISHPQTGSASEDDPDPTPTSEEGQWVSGRKLVILSNLLIAAMFLMMLDTSIISTAIPRITDEFHSLEDVGWYISIYQFANAALQPIWGRIYHKFSNKAAFLTALAIFEVGSLICGIAVSSPMLIVGRAVAGIGSAGLVSGGLTITASAVPIEKRAPLTAILMGISQLGVAFGPILGGVFTSYATWRWCFYINLPIGALLLLGICLVPVPDQIQKPSPWSVIRELHYHFDICGFILIAGAAFQILLALSWGGSKYEWDSGFVTGLFSGAAGLIIIWLVWNWHRGDAGLIPISLIKVQAVNLVQITGYVIPYALMAAAAGSISNGMYSTFSPTTSTAEWVGYQILNGFGRGVGMPMAVLAVQAAIPPADLAMGNAIIIFVQSLGSAIALSVSDAIFQTNLVSEIALKAPHADAAAIIVAGATRFRSVVNEQDLPGVLEAYALSIDRVFYLAAGLSCLGMLTALGMGWVNISKKQRMRNAGIPLQDLSASQRV
ncbi:major facilitator superfamily domain-containing protein [Chaetomium sp. MPI-SDFR-AT-0129]|nr:major facilitator superfamily domain-containing protein [Chaetomium sp. MPI-SDFR-AT-0129]